MAGTHAESGNSIEKRMRQLRQESKEEEKPEIDLSLLEGRDSYDGFDKKVD